MNIFDRATDLHVLLSAAIEADTSDTLLSRGRLVRRELEEAAAYFEASDSFRSTLESQEMANIDVKGLRQAMGRFRGALRSRPAALQQQTADTLLTVVKKETTRLDRWVRSVWKSRFEDFRSLLEKVESRDLTGSNSHWKVAFSCASRLRRAQNTHPIHEAEELERLLDSRGLVAWLEQIDALGDELRIAIEAIEQEHATLTPEVQKILERAGSGEGFPLAEITSDVLEALESAGVLDGLVVRRL